MIITTLLGYFLLVLFFYVERRLRVGDAAKSLEADEVDRRTTRYLGYAYFVGSVALLAAWALHAFRIANAPDWVGWLGILLALFGLFMRTWANRVLGPYYTRTLKVAEGQAISQKGPYRLIRHPGYLGMILMWTGVAAATDNWLILLIIVAVILAAYHYRIQNEEKLLLKSLPGYAEYQAHSWKLIPLIY